MKCVKGIYALPEGRRRAVFTDGTTTARSRLIAAIKLGRGLEPQEVVHHINGNCADDRLGNLEVFPTNAIHLVARHGGPGGTNGPSDAEADFLRAATFHGLS